ncbi:MAG: hypothetical protein QJR12_08795 [Mycobacterium sp.]|uniref:hypothetical protein n=1 Tax=Mycobacterium sp. TaxID=1785 RepID=UPI00262074D8|nr:hypothetical protein [Mycobacterium sp.]MDI3314359.1 hypothetical protein [Mycobacterium sp.]
MSSTASVVSRRQLLAGGAALVVLGAVAPGCGSPPPPPAVDELQSQLESARNDSELATAAAATELGQLAAALREVALERSRHAQALATEIDRVAGRTTTTSSAPAGPVANGPAAPAPSLSDVINALHASADSATRLAARLSGYRAGLLGSIAASCTAAYTVALAIGAPTP